MAIERKSMVTMGQRLRAARTARQMTLRGLAAEVGIPHEHVSKIERDLSKSIHTQTMVKLCRALGVSSDWLCCVWDGWEPESDSGGTD